MRARVDICLSDGYNKTVTLLRAVGSAGRQRDDDSGADRQPALPAAGATEGGIGRP